MRQFHVTNQRSYRPSVNIERLWSLVSDQTRTKYADAKADSKVPVIDVVRAVSLIISME